MRKNNLIDHMGLIKHYYSNGSIYSQEYLLNGKLEGEREVWYDNGQIAALEFYRKGKIEGKRKTWYDNGQIMCHEFYRNGKLYGKCRNQSRDAEAICISFYKNDKTDGELRFLCAYSSFLQRKYYLNGQLVDRNFTYRKKIAWLKLRKRLESFVHDKNADILGVFIISDLLN